MLSGSLKEKDPIDFSVGILAGGESRRMGENKALLNLAGSPAISHVIEALGVLSDDLFIVGGRAADYSHLGLPHVADQYDFRASIVGVYSAIAAARYEYCLVVSCDMPFAEPAFARYLAMQAAGKDAVVPVSDDGIEPLFALYSKSCLKIISEQIESGELAIKAALSRLNVHDAILESADSRVDRQVAFLNVNTSAELRQAERILLKEKGACRDVCSAARLPAATVGRKSPPLICFVGRKNSGKTTFLVKLVQLLKSRGLRVAFIKHDVHGISMDHEGTDTWKLAQAGASEVAISSPDILATVKHVDREPDLAEICSGIGAGVDIVIGEGFKSCAADRIEISRSERSTSLACREDELVAVISDRTDAAATIPVFGLEDVEGVASLLFERYGLATSMNGSD